MNMHAFCEAKERINSMLKFLLSLILALFILTHSVPSFSAPLEIQVGPGWIMGKGDGVALGKVLTEVTKKSGYPIFVDEKLLKTPVSFNIEDKLAPERFIKRIVRPHSYAIVFGSEDKNNVSTIHEVWVFPKGQQFKSRYADLSAASVGVNAAVSSSSGDVSGISGGKSVDPKRIVKRSLHVKETAYGGSSFTYKDPKKGPDYRPTQSQIQEAYWKFRSEKRQLERRKAERMQSQVRREFEASRDEYWARKNTEIRQRIMELKNARDKEEAK